MAVRRYHAIGRLIGINFMVLSICADIYTEGMLLIWRILMLNVFKLLNRIYGRTKLDKKVLRKNDISLLILDERWNSLFKNIEKTPEIEKCEEKLRELLKLQARLISESKENAALKKKYLNRIMELTTDAYENGNEESKEEMRQCEKEIRRINNRNLDIEKELEKIPEHIRQANLTLLDYAVNIVYFRIRSDQKRVAELEKQIEETREKLRLLIDEKETLSQDYNEIYSYFHDLLGPEELEKLDRKFFK